jgi:hypothetical protein
MGTLMTLFVSLVMDSSGFTSGLASAANQTQSAGGQMQGDLKGVGGAAKDGMNNAAGAVQQLTGVSLTGIGALMGVVSALKASVGAAIESERVMASTEAIIRATGGAAGYTAAEIETLAGQLSMMSAIDDETVQSGLNMMLTFKNIGEETFPRASEAMLDMALAMANGDTSAVNLKSTAIQLGKALNDPIAGASALARVGVTLSDAQKDQIEQFMEMNDIASAQAVILAELESEFGGMAEAMGGTNAGKIEKAKNDLANMSEEIGGVLLPTLGEAASAFSTFTHGVDNINTALGQNNRAIAANAGSYDEYLATLEEQSQGLLTFNKLLNALTAGAIPIMIQKQGALTEADWSYIHTLEEIRKGISADAEQTWEWSDATHTMVPIVSDVTDALLNYNSQLDTLNTAISGPVGDELEDWADKQAKISDEIEETQGKIAELEGLRYLSPDQKADLDEAKQKLDELGQEALDAAEDHRKAMAGIIYDMMEVRAQADGVITADEYSALKTYAENMGIVDQATLDAEYAMQMIQDKLAEGPEYYANYAKAMERMTLALEDGKIDASELYQILGILTGQGWNINVGVNLHDQELQNLANLSLAGGVNIVPMANGGDFLVTRPTLFMAGEAGTERATFTPLGKEPPGAGNGAVYNVYVQGDDTDAVMRGLHAHQTFYPAG